VFTLLCCAFVRISQHLCHGDKARPLHSLSLPTALCTLPYLLTACCNSYRRQVEEQQRQELLAQAPGAADFRIERDAEAQGISYIENSKRVLEEAFQTGTSVLTNMSGQRERLKASEPQPGLHYVWPHASPTWPVVSYQTSTFAQICAILNQKNGKCLWLQSAHRKMLDVVNSLGLSDSLLRVIERRQRLDKWIVYGGMVSKLHAHGWLLLVSLWLLCC
jgi:golgi SNAP receptor complex member 2